MATLRNLREPYPLHLADVLVLYYIAGMEESRSQSTVNLVSELIRSSPGWVRTGITAPSRRVRDAAITSLADHVAAGLAHVRDEDRDQLHLPL